ncbi:hypothetical protein B0A55_09369 [Friedmanniomyces simplex]|uniref:Uncharacterized protein n=1 Tax=Friedmanniomyces simplex TaxID=329884 RepID=A0A4U0WWS7_9PEZI|nr:hypothetical protein B0A55_09369 [Friedmanniomyces simplex]
MRTTSMLALVGLAFTGTIVALPAVSVTSTVDHLTEVGPESTGVNTYPNGPPFTGHPPVISETPAAVSSHKPFTGYPPSITAPPFASRSLNPRPAQPRTMPDGLVELSPDFVELLARHVEAEAGDRPMRMKLPVPDDTTTLRGLWAHEPAMPPRDAAAAHCTVNTLFGGQAPIITTVCAQPAPACTPCVGCNANQCVEKREDTSLPIAQSVTRAFPWPTELSSITKTVLALPTIVGETSHSMVPPSPFPTPSKRKREMISPSTPYPDTKTMLPSTVLTFSTSGTMVVALPTAVCNSTVHDGCIATSGATETKQMLGAVLVVALLMAAAAVVLRTAAGLSGDDGDDFFSGFNALSEEYSTPPKANPPVRAVVLKEKRESRVKSAKRQDVPPPGKEGAAEEATEMVGSISALTARLDNRVNGNATAKPGTAFKRITSLPNTNVKLNRAARRESARKLARDAPLVETAAASSTGDQAPTIADTTAESVRKERAEFESIMAGLVPEASPQQHSRLGSLIDKLVARKEKRTPVDEVRVPTDTSMKQANGVEAAPTEARPRIEKPDFSFPSKTGASTSMSARPEPVINVSISINNGPAQTEHIDKPPYYETALGRRYSFSTLRKPQSPAAKQREMNSKPGWGDSSSVPAKASKASFASLRQADKVSAVPVIRTAGERTAWGKEPVHRNITAAVVEAADSLDQYLEKMTGNPDWTPAGQRHTQGMGEESASSGQASASSHGLREELKRRLLGSKVETMLDPSHNEEATDKLSMDYSMHERATRQTDDDTDEKSRGPTPDSEEGGFGETVQEDESNSKTKFRIKRIVSPHDALTMPNRRGVLKLYGEAGAKKRSDAISKGGEAMPQLAGSETPTNENLEVNDAEVARMTRRQRTSMVRKLNASDGVQSYATRYPLSALPGKQNVERVVKDGQEVLDQEAEGDSSLFNDAGERLAKLHSHADAQPAKTEEHRSLAEVMAGSSEKADIKLPEETPLPAPEPYETPADTSDIRSVSAGELTVTALNIKDQPSVPPLQYGLDRVLFNSGVYQMQDPLSRTYNFDPYLQKIMPISEFDFNALKEYKTSSQDGFLDTLANEHGKKYVGSTSSMTGTLGHFHYLLSNWRPINLDMLSRGFKEQLDTFTLINRAPNSVFLRYKPETGTYAIDADKEYDSANVLMMLGKSMEKLLTLPKEQYERYRRNNTKDPITPTEKEELEAFEYTTMGDFLMRSQLDAHDARLPGNGMFDLKTRAVLPIRMDTEGYEEMLGYEILTLQGSWESFEREYYDMLRSTMLKYMLQARMGRMEGIFMAYHNIERVFGFQYMPMMEIDRAMHGQVDPCLGDQEFRLSLRMLNEVLEMATKEFPERSLRVHFESAASPASMMWVFAEPMEEEEIETIQGKAKKQIAEFEADVMGIERKSAATAEPVTEGEEVGDEDAMVRAAEASAGDASTVPVQPASDDAVLQSTDDAEPENQYATTTAPADSAFIESVSNVVEDNLKPLFAATLIVQSFVNGVPCEHNRPRDLKRDDKWEVQYILKQAPLGLAEKWARYEGLKGRRRSVFRKAGKADALVGVDGDGEGDVVKEKETGYMRMLKEMVAKGRRFRQGMDAFEGKQGRRVKMREEEGELRDNTRPVVDAEMPMKEDLSVKTEFEQAAAAGSEEEKIESVEGYMQWLYRKLIIDVGRLGAFPANLLLGRPYYYTYELLEKKEGEAYSGLRVVPPSELSAEVAGTEHGGGAETPDDIEDSIPTEEVVDAAEAEPKNNRLTVDSPSRQTLTQQEIEDLKKSAAGKEVIAKILANHAGLDEKTVFSKAKYMLRKRSKYLKRFTVLPMEIGELIEHLLEKEPGRIMEMREETVGLVGAWSNVHVFGGGEVERDRQGKRVGGGRWLVIDETGGLVVAALAERMGILRKEEDEEEEEGGEEVPANGLSSNGHETGDGDVEMASAQSSTANGNGSHISNGTSKPAAHRDFPPPASTNTLTILHPAVQPNLSLLKYFGYDTNIPDPTHPLHTHLKTLSWLQLLHPNRDPTYREPDKASEKEMASWKSGKRGTYWKKRRRWERCKAIVDETREGGFEGLVVATSMDPITILPHVIPLIRGGGTVVLYSPTPEPLVKLTDLYSKDRRTAFIHLLAKYNTIPDAISKEDFPLDPRLLLAPTLQTSRIREWQVLPGRTHPMMTSRGGSEGYVFTARRVVPVEGGVEARGNFAGARKRKAVVSSAVGEGEDRGGGGLGPFPGATAPVTGTPVGCV